MNIKTEGKQYWSIVGAAFVVALALQFFSVTFVLPALVFGLMLWRMPAPHQMDSFVGRALLALVFTLVLLQVSALVQFLVWPQSNFLYVASLFAVFSFVMLYAFGRAPSQWRWFTRYDAAGLLVAAMFLLPLIWMVRHDTIANIVSIAGLQSPDAGHHFEFIGDMQHEQHLDASGYPKTFHLAVGFLQSAFVGTQDSMSWQGNVVSFFAQYVIFGVMLAMSLGYICMLWLERMLSRVPSKGVSVLAGLAVAMPLQLVTLWPFVEHGFLNYLFMASVLVCAVMYADVLLKQGKPREVDIVFVLLLLLSASLSWPLVVPATLLGVLIALWPVRPKELWPLIKHHWIAAILVLLQVAPLIIQLLRPGTTSVNDQGDLRTFAAFLLSFGLVVAIFVSRFLPRPSRRVLVALIVPFSILTGAILCMQLVLFGEPRYFAIKVALLVEAFLVPLCVAGLFAWGLRRKVANGALFLLLCAPLGVTLLLLTASGKPLEDVRNLFRDQMGQIKPAFYNHDVSEYTKLGKAGKINHFNSTVLHSNPANGKLYSHPFLPQVVQMMKYPRTTSGLEAFMCHRLIFNNLAYGDFSEVKQRELVMQVRTCVDIAARNGQKYYIITDKDSLERVKTEVGEGRGAVYVGQ